MNLFKKYNILILVVSILFIKFFTYNPPKPQVNKSPAIDQSQLLSTISKKRVSAENSKTKISIIKKKNHKKQKKALFLKLMTKAKRLSPKLSFLHSSTDHELHHMPSILADFAEVIGHIKETLNKDNASDFEKSQAGHFFKECSVDESIFDSARSICLTNLLLLAHKTRVAVDLSLYPNKILALSNTILDLE